ncbi:MAG: acetate--CoA ligase family protein [Candidatus Shapirobacteria bacterium]|jgi:acetyltransferase
MSRDLSGLFNPKSIAVIGASRSPKKLGAIVLKNINISGFSGRVYPVNPNVYNVGPVKFYPDVASLPEVPDLAVIAIPAGGVLGVLEECGKAGIKNIVIFSAGFKEAGEEGQALEKQLIAIATYYKFNILGPNCLGFASTVPPLNVTFGQVIKNRSSLRFISQSGALASSLFDWCQSTGLGFNSFITIGNKAVVNENDILEYWLPQLGKSSETTRPVGLYLESIVSGQDFIKTVKQITPHNPVFILKPGRSAAAVEAMRSHTGAIAGEDRVLRAALAEAGAIHCQELGDFFDLAQALAWKNAPRGPQVAIVSNAGGPAVMTTDTVADCGLEMAKFSRATHQKLLECLPRVASALNPVDVLGDALAQRFGEALEIILQEKTAHAIVALLTPQLMTQIEKTAEIIGKLSARYSQPIFCSFIGGYHTVDGKKILNQYKIPNYSYPERAIKVIAKMWQWQNWRKHRSVSRLSGRLLTENLPGVEKILNQAVAAKLPTLDNLQADRLMGMIKVPTPPTEVITSVNQAVIFGRKYGWPVVLKLSSVGLLHKSNVGGVIVGIKSARELTNDFNKLVRKTAKLKKENGQETGIQIQKQVVGGIEIIFGIRRDACFGHIFLFGAGGKYAEVLDDHNLGLLPITLEKAKKLVARSKIFKMLSGYRDDPPYNLSRLYEIMMTLGQLVTSYPQIKEIEVNPMIITHKGVWAVDPKVILNQENN